MRKRLRHGAYRAAVAIGFIPFTLIALAAAAYEPVDAFYQGLRRWAYQEKYIRERLPAPELDERWRRK